MNSEISNETQLIAEIDRLREQFPQTQDLYREVCTLLFFRYGTTPTANKLYQLVRKGSMSAPAEALTKFWSNLRDKSRTRIEHPDLPDELKTAAGDFAVAVWTSAQDQASQHMAGYRQEAELVVAEAKNAAAAAAAERQQVESLLEKAQDALAEKETRISELEQALAASNATSDSFEKQLSQSRLENTSLQERLEVARREFSQQIERLREATAQAEERFQLSEKRSLLEIDRERQASARLQKELEGMRAEMTRASARQHDETESFQAQIGNLRQQLGALEGKLYESTEAKKELTGEVRELTFRVQELTSHAVTLQAELQGWRARAERAEMAISQQPKEKPTRRSKKDSAS